MAPDRVDHPAEQPAVDEIGVHGRLFTSHAALHAEGLRRGSTLNRRGSQSNRAQAFRAPRSSAAAMSLSPVPAHAPSGPGSRCSASRWHGIELKVVYGTAPAAACRHTGFTVSGTPENAVKPH